MPSLFSMARSLLRERTSLPLSKITGFIPCSINFKAANKPAGPAPIISTEKGECLTSLNIIFVEIVLLKGSLIKAITERLTHTCLLRAS